MAHLFIHLNMCTHVLRGHVYHSMLMEVGGQLCESSYLSMHRFWGLNLDHHTFSTNNFYLISLPLGSLSLYPTLVYLFIFFLIFFFFRRVHSVAWLLWSSLCRLAYFELTGFTFLCLLTVVSLYLKVKKCGKYQVGKQNPVCDTNFWASPVLYSKNLYIKWFYFSLLTVLSKSQGFVFWIELSHVKDLRTHEYGWCAWIRWVPCWSNWTGVMSPEPVLPCLGFEMAFVPQPSFEISRKGDHDSGSSCLQLLRSYLAQQSHYS